MKLAFFGYPHLGGTFTVFRHLRDGLAASGSGIAVEWLGIGPDAHAVLQDHDWRSEWSTGHAAGSLNDDEPVQAEAMISHLVREGFDGVVVNVHADRVQTNLARYLPRSILRLMIVHNITPATYSAAVAIRDHVHATVCVSDRIRDDLMEKHGFRPSAIHRIHNAVELPPPAPARRRAASQPLHLLSLGRVEDQAKGVLWLPEILARLPDDVSLTVAGDGPDLERLRRASTSLGQRIRFLGRVSPTDVPALMASHDVLIAPSRFEGFMITLAEAMAAGCVPVASRIGGVTDTVVEDGVTGLLFPVGDIAAAAEAIRRLRGDPVLWQVMSRDGPSAMRARFSIDRMARDYEALLACLDREPPSIAAPLALDKWRLPRGLRGGLRSHLPTPIKNWLRGIRERAA
ncbi:glycosyltransferase family 4 protein [Kaistia sp. MMO-174]|uniref:glycosyltransferase family 4 protein n=1 Tax=Kaistia sp. MMO-174 TaxID=3081256 RepID=UPI00301A4A84